VDFFLRLKNKMLPVMALSIDNKSFGIFHNEKPLSGVESPLFPRFQPKSATSLLTDISAGEENDLQSVFK
jgi:hypothetical protein